MVVLGQDPATCAQVVGSTGSFALRVGGLFAILGGSAVLTFLPLIARNRCQLLLHLGSCFATGVVLATAFVHMLPDAAAAMSSPCLGLSSSYPWSSTIAGFVVIIACVIENTLKGFMLKNYGVTSLEELEADDDVNSVDSGELGGAQDGSTDGARDIKLSQREQLRQADLAMTAIFLEGGIVFHSVFVGINYGILENDSTSVALLIALVFHQAFDGLALGSAFVRAGFSRLKYCIFAALFVMVTPCGIAIGIGVSQSYAPGSKAALGTEAAFNSVSAGLLVYNSLINLMVAQFKPVSISHRPRLQAAQYGSLAAGYCCMALVGKWA
mmetsp:Transcript_19033/g.57508  ORF Transcript_19033/g.57508 Transcript_19033/m.57508 type:complete len:326 (-) Transcript_19033:773-1750(-)|eukprot:CAMPEP_0206137774 /NCGR_PEP_ID=MMETSP1473-20131121/2830_1 /ASSEMBLY_ACC=CAM_ASM_001109 /TAXON_ID=1461547 /ORGANISM="Stichococcus sp, Strain RCC1054" /LENGTH=325 /DNA_ID=CAMNT_0053531007 /DNA_START=322 /DNA_END=1299 /DNA_ORIENTATION=+